MRMLMTVAVLAAGLLTMKQVARSEDRDDEDRDHDRDGSTLTLAVYGDARVAAMHRAKAELYMNRPRGSIQGPRHGNCRPADISGADRLRRLDRTVPREPRRPTAHALADGAVREPQHSLRRGDPAQAGLAVRQDGSPPARRL